MPEQPGRLLEGRMRSELVDGKSCDDELARLAINQREVCCCSDYIIETVHTLIIMITVGCDGELPERGVMKILPLAECVSTGSIISF